MQAINYAPPGKVARAFMLSDAFFRGIMGPFGSGKSTACIMEILRRARQQEPGADAKRRSRWAIVRNTYPELRTTTIRTWHQWVPASLGRWVDQGPPTHHIEEGDLDLEVLFLALDRPDDIAKLLSMELTGAWINEAREVPKAVVDGLTGRVGRYPSRLMGGATWSGLIADTNPPDTDHWWYRLAEEQRPDGWAFFRQPGGLDPAAENVENLPAGYYERLRAGKDEDWLNVYVHANYGFVRDGKPVFHEFRDRVHVRDLEAVSSWPLHVGVDFGLTPAAVFAQRSPTGQWRVLGELVASDMGARRFAELLRHALAERWPGLAVGSITGDPAGEGRAQTDETTPFQILRAAGIDARPASTNDFTKRREAVAACLTRLIDGEPGIVVDPRAAQLRKALGGGYAYRRVQVVGEERYRDQPDKNHFSHVADALQYLLVGGGEAKAIVRRARPAFRQPQALSDYAIME